MIESGFILFQFLLLNYWCQYVIFLLSTLLLVYIWIIRYILNAFNLVPNIANILIRWKCHCIKIEIVNSYRPHKIMSSTRSFISRYHTQNAGAINNVIYGCCDHGCNMSNHKVVSMMGLLLVIFYQPLTLI